MNEDASLREQYGPQSGETREEETSHVEGERLNERSRNSLVVALRETAETVLLALVIFLLVRAAIQNFKVEGSSMEPTLHSGQYLLVNKIRYFSVDTQKLGKLFPVLPLGGGLSGLAPFGNPQRGDIIVFHSPRDPGRDFIKRVVGLPGDVVEIRGEEVYVNGLSLEEPYIAAGPAYSKEATTVPGDSYFVLGDNRNNSSDSHVWGPVPKENIVGKAWLSYWPLNQWGPVPNYKVEAGPNQSK